MKKPLFDSKGNIEPWGRDFWAENMFAEFIIIFGGTAFIISLFIFGIIFILKIIN